MARRTLSDGSGRWFNDESAVRFDEATRWNGSNHISRATGSQWDHEALYYTKSGRWILNAWSQWQGSTETYSEIDESDAIAWLSHNECWSDEGISALPATIRDRVAAGFAAAEM